MERWWDGSTWTEYTGRHLGRPATGPGSRRTPYPGDVVGTPTPAAAAHRRRGHRDRGLARHDRRRHRRRRGLVLSSSSEAPPARALAGLHSARAAGSLPESGADGPVGPADPGSPGADGGQGQKSTAHPWTRTTDRLPVLTGWQGTSRAAAWPRRTWSRRRTSAPGDPTETACAAGSSPSPRNPQAHRDHAEAVGQAGHRGRTRRLLRPEIYGTTTSHQEWPPKPVTVAGQKGYMVRWKIVTSLRHRRLRGVARLPLAPQAPRASRWSASGSTSAAAPPGWTSWTASPRASRRTAAAGER